MAARQIQYEDLVPKSEWKDQPEATLLTIDLPGFAKEQIKVTYVQTSRMIRVTGERPVSDRRWSRFNEVFTVPQNCQVDKIHGSLKNNVLTITMPKETITKMPNLPESSKTVEKIEEKRLLEESRRKEKVEEAEKMKKKLLEEKEGLIRKLQEEAKAKEMAEMRKLQDEEKEKLQERKLVEEAKMIHEKKSVDESEKILKPEERKLPEVVYTKSGPRTVVVNTKSEPESETKPGFGGEDQVVKSAEDKLSYLVEKEKKIGKGIMEKIRRKQIKSEEKKLMMNVGVSAFVIFALGAYVSYTICSSSSSSTKPK